MPGRRLLAAILPLLVLAAAGCRSSGSWEDDPGNWAKAFKSSKPDHVVVVHSRYWRSPHFTLEFESFFHIQANEDLREQLFTANSMHRVDKPDAETPDEYFSFFQEKPAWFLPKPRERYEVWVSGGFHVYIDKDNGDLFLQECQV
jgi:hypothetical protein